MSWQPISTAPKDGTPILAWVPGYWSKDMPMVIYWSDTFNDWFYDRDPVSYYAQPTLWQPLPEPPC